MSAVFKIFFIITVTLSSLPVNLDSSQFTNGQPLNGNNGNLQRRFNRPQFGNNWPSQRNNWRSQGNNWPGQGNYWPSQGNYWPSQWNNLPNQGSNQNDFNNQRRPEFFQHPANNDKWYFGPQEQYPGQGNPYYQQIQRPNPNPVFGFPEDHGQNTNQEPTQQNPNNNNPGQTFGITRPDKEGDPQDLNNPDWSQRPQPPKKLIPVPKPVNNPKRPIQKPAQKPSRPIDDFYDEYYDEPVAILGRPVIVPTTTTIPPDPDLIIFKPDKDETDELKRCVQDCPTASEYNPICGTNNVTYFNPARFKCARECGVRVFIHLRGRCAPDTPFQSQLK